MKFINRKKEIAALESYLASTPGQILIVYGPKSSGKTNLLNHYASNYLKSKKYAVNILNLRGMLISNFSSFLDQFFPKNIGGKVKDLLSGITINSGFFGVSLDEESLLKSNPFKVMETKILSAKKRGVQPVIILDEIQQLKNIYLNGERNLLDELFNLFVRLTKELHAAHIIIATSDSYFLNEIYENAKLVKTARFLKVGQFDKEEVAGWLETEGFTKKEITTTWKTTGGNPWEIQQVINAYAQGKKVPATCQRLVEENGAVLFTWLFYKLNNAEQKALFYELMAAIVKHGHYNIETDFTPALSALVKELVERDFLFFDPNQQVLLANSESVRLAMGKLLEKGKG